MIIFRRLIAASTICLAALTAAAQSQPSVDSQPARVSLRGQITRPDGRPLPGAVAYIYTAGLRKGTGSL